MMSATEKQMIVERNTCYIRVKIDDEMMTPALARAIARELVQIAEEIEPDRVRTEPPPSGDVAGAL